MPRTPDPQLERIRVALRANHMSDKGTKEQCLLRLLTKSAPSQPTISKRAKPKSTHVCAKWTVDTLKDIADDEDVRISGNKAELVNRIGTIITNGRSTASVVKRWTLETLKNVCRDVDQPCSGNKDVLVKRVASIIRSG